MTRIFRSSLVVLSLVFCGSCLAAGPGQPPAAPGGVAPRARPGPTNIKALPKDISEADLIKLMREYTGDLGVQCSFCHAQDPTTRRTDFASDANPKKDTARTMIRMTADINGKYLASLPDGADPVTCGTCHQGQSHPPAFVPKPPAPRPPAGN